MVIFSHRGIGFGKKENSQEALSIAIRKGSSVEVDLRFKDNKIVLSHDENADTGNSDNFDNLLTIIKNNPKVFFALHLKDNSSIFFRMACESVYAFKNCLLFVTDFRQDNFIEEAFRIISREQLALYITDRYFNVDLLEKVSYLWFDESKSKIYDDLDYYLVFNKRIILCSPELFLTDYKDKLILFREIAESHKSIFGICTDFPEIFLKTKVNYCPACNANGAFERVDQIDDYVILKCPFCLLEFTESMHYDAAYYEHLHYSDEPNLNRILAMSRNDFLNRALKLLEDFNWQPHNLIFKWIERNIKKHSIILDIGCGVGWFIAALEASDYKTVGIEVSTKIVDMLRIRGFQVYKGPLEDIEQDLPQPDLVILLGVIEHVKDPVALLTNIKHRFSRTKLLISIPNPKRWDFNIGIRNYWDYPPNHLTPVWSERSLESVLKRTGFALKDWFFPGIAADEIWFVLMDWLLLKLGWRKKGCFVGLVSEYSQNRTLVKVVLRLFYREFEIINRVAKYSCRPMLNIIAHKLENRGFSGLSAFAIAEPM